MADLEKVYKTEKQQVIESQKTSELNVINEIPTRDRNIRPARRRVEIGVNSVQRRPFAAVINPNNQSFTITENDDENNKPVDL